MVRRKSLIASCALLAMVALPVAAQSPVPPNGESGTIPPSGMGATTSGQRVILLPDGTWKTDEHYSLEEMTAVTDHGQTITLTRGVDPKTKDVTLQWSYSGLRGGPLQIAVSRAITTDRSAHSSTDNCIPVVSVRNLSQIGLFRILIELEFTAPDGSTSGANLMAGPLDEGEETDIVANALFLNGCKNLTAKLQIPYCKFDHGLDCRHAVTASRVGAIPVELAAPATQAAVPKTQ